MSAGADADAGYFPACRIARARRRPVPPQHPSRRVLPASQVQHTNDSSLDVFGPGRLNSFPFLDPHGSKRNFQPAPSHCRYGGGD